MAQRYWPLSMRPRQHDRFVLLGLCWLYGRSEFPPPPPPALQWHGLCLHAHRPSHLALTSVMRRSFHHRAHRLPLYDKKVALHWGVYIYKNTMKYHKCLVYTSCPLLVYQSECDLVYQAQCRMPLVCLWLLVYLDRMCRCLVWLWYTKQHTSSL